MNPLSARRSRRAGRRRAAHREAELEREGRWPELEASLRQRLERGGGSRCKLAFVIAQQGRAAEAETVFLQALEEGDTPETALLNLGVLAKRDGRREEAIRRFEEVLARGDERAAVELADLLADGPRGAEAEALYRRAVEAGDRSAPAYLARYLWGTGREDELEALYRLARERGHGPAPSLELACFLRMTDPARESEARALVAEALVAPIPIRVLESVVRQEVVSEDAAIWALRTAAELATSPEASVSEEYRDQLLDELNSALRRADRLAELELVLRERIEQGERRHLCLLGWTVLQEDGREDEAKAILEEAIEAGVEVGLALANLGAIACLDGPTEESAALYEEAVSAGYLSATTKLADQLEGIGRGGEVEALLARAAEAGDAAAAKALAARLGAADCGEERERLLRIAAERGDAEAPLALACLLRSKAPEAGPEARSLLRQALEAPIDPEQVRWVVGDEALPSPTAIWIVREALEIAAGLSPDRAYGAASHRAELLFLLGYRLEGDPDRRAEAMTLFHAAAERGHEMGVLFLGLMFERQKMPGEARRCFEFGSESGDPWSMRGLARVLREEGDLAGAERALLQAADLGDERAERELAKLRDEQAAGVSET